MDASLSVGYFVWQGQDAVLHMSNKEANYLALHQNLQPEATRRHYHE